VSAGGNRALVDRLDALLDLGQDLRRAFLRADRAAFLPASVAPESRYVDRPIPIGHGQTNSQPYTVAFMLKLLNVHSGDAVLDLGSGSGWTAALLTVLAGGGGTVTGLERIPQLIEFGRNNLSGLGFDPNIVRPAGVLPGVPGRRFDRILVSAAAQSIPPSLLEQLAPQGVMVIPVKSSIWRVRRIGSGEHRDGRASTEFLREEYPGFSFVPLI
jgi:protein-L-isoaspartate(D-aspartate) O-methyltransferase